MDNGALDERRIDLASRIFTDAEGLTGSEAAEGMYRAINAADSDILDKLDAEFFPTEEEEN